MNLIILRGLPRSGKSTIANRIGNWLKARGHEAYVVSLDEIRMRTFGMAYWEHGEREVWSAAESIVAYLCEFADIVIVDECNLNKAERAKWAKFRSPSIDVKFLNVTTPIDICLQRAEGTDLKQVIRDKSVWRWDGGLQDAVETDGTSPMSDTELWRVVNALGLVESKASA